MLARLFYAPPARPDTLRIFEALFKEEDITVPGFMAVPSRLVATQDRSDWDYALFFIG